MYVQFRKRWFAASSRLRKHMLLYVVLKKPSFFALLLIFAFTIGCSNTESTSQRAAEVPVFHTGNSTNDTILALSPEKQAVALAHAVQSGCVGQDSFYNGMRNDSAFWSIRCTNGQSYMVEIQSDASGSTRVLDCTTMKAVGANTCFQKF